MEYQELLNEVKKLSNDDRQKLINDAIKVENNPDELCHKNLMKYLSVVSDCLGTSPRIVMSRSRQRPLPEARGMMYHKLREDGFSFTMIGRMAGVNHSTVMHAIKLVNEKVENPRYDPMFSKLYADFIARISND